MEFVIGIVSSIFTKAAEYTISPIINHVKYLSNHQQNVETLKDKAEKLKDARDRVQHSVDAALRNGKEIEGDVDKWLSAVDRKITEQVEKVMQDEEKAKKKCFIGLCPNFWTRYKHSLKAAAEAKAVAELLEQGKFDEVSYPMPLQGIAVPPVKGYEDFESRTLVLNGIMEALNDDSVSVIGVHGMGGIGKTMLVKEIARKVKGNLFDSVVIATVTQTIDIEKIQNRIAELLGLNFEEPSTDVKALRLRERLKKEKRVLVVLDDIWAKVDIEEVGIPLGDEHKGCKLLLTSRELNVLSNGMDAQKCFAIGFLNEKEAWDLFKKKAGGCVESCDSKPIAMEVAKKCAGLPIAIATVAGALRNKRLFEWKNALRELERPSSSNFTGIAAAYSAIEWSFNYLESEEVKLTFLLCCVIGHNGLVEKLMRYTVGLGLFGGVNTMEEARNEVLTVVANLKASSLLLDSYDDEHFDIHDVVWDAALAIASKDYHMLVLRDHIPKEWSDKAKMNSLRVISLPCPQIVAELPREMEYSGLSFFHMAHDDSVAIPPDFFGRIKSLEVLDLPHELSFTFLPGSIIHLPGSIINLINLRMLCLRGWRVEDITIIGELKNLEILDLALSRIKELPKKIAQLTRLRLLDLSWCGALKIIPPNVLSSLSKLEELYMEGSFVEWENEGVVDNERRNASLDELNNLSRLTTLYVRIPDIQMIPKHRFIETLNRYRIFVGDHLISNWPPRHECSRRLALQLYSNICLDNGVKMLLGKAEDLYLDLKGLEGIKNVLAELNKGNDFPHLQSLHVRNGMQVQYITMNKIKFSELRSITLEQLPQLISFCCQEERCSTSFEPQPLLINQTYSNLRRLIISGCGKLEHLLSPSVARSLVLLHRFEIVHCESLREIIFTEEIEEEEEMNNVICFRRLNFLRMDFLPNLISFCSGNYNIEFPSLKELTIGCCPKLKEFISESSIESGMHTLFNEKVAVPSLETMTISKLSNVKMIFHTDLPPNSFQHLRELSVSGCEILKNLFPASIAKHLLQLEDLSIRDCGVEEIVSEGKGVEDQPVRFEFPEVSSLEVTSLKELKCFYKGQHAIVWPMLKKLTTDGSALLMIMGLEDVRIQERKGNGEAVVVVEEVIPNLEQLELRRLSDEGQFPLNLFHHVKVLKVNGGFGDGFPIFPFLRKICNLESLDLELFSFRDGLPCKGDVGTPSRIKKLNLSHLRNLQRMWRKDSELGHILSNLQTLTVMFCDDLINIGASSLSFKNLTTLKVSYCPMMTNLATPLIVESLVQLTTMEVSSCTKMTEIVAHEGDYRQTIVVGKLKCLKLSYLRRLTSFCRGSYTFNFPYLEEVVVEVCPKLKIFSEGVLNTPQLQSVKPNSFDKKGCWAGDLNTTIQQLYMEEGQLYGRIDHLTISNKFPESIEIWKKNPRAILELKNLSQMKFYQCSSLKYIFTLSMLLSLKQLERINVQECDTMEQVIREDEEEATTHEFTFPKLSSVEIKACSNLTNFYLGSRALEFPKLSDIAIAGCPKMTAFISRESEKVIGEQGVGDNTTTLFCDKVVVPSLETMTIFQLSNVKMIFQNDLPSDSFQNLRKLSVSGCESLKILFPASIVKHLLQLEDLSIIKCGVEEIVSEGEGVEEQPMRFEFPKVSSLVVEDLKELKCPYKGQHTILWPMLKTLSTNSSALLMIVALEDVRLMQERKGNGEAAMLTEQIIPNLEQLRLRDLVGDVGQFPPNLFPHIKVLKGHHGGSPFIFFFLRRFYNLKSLEFDNFDFKHVVPCEGDVGTPSPIKNLQLTSSKNLKHIWKKDSELGHILSNLQTLTIKNCDDLINLGASSLSFKNLTTLKVSNCAMMANLATPLIVESLVQLTTMEVSNCTKMTEIVANEGDYHQTIVVRNLKCLQLSNLESLTSFCPGSYTFNFLCLEEVVVEGCPKLKIFSEGVLSTPQLQSVKKSSLYMNRCWAGDLNTTIQQLYMQKVGCLDLDVLTISDTFPELIEIWKKSPRAVLELTFLGKIKFYKCSSLKYIFTSSMLLSLKLLRRIEVKECNTMEQVIREDEEEATTHEFTFPELSSVEIKACFNLTNFYLGSRALEFPKLSDIEIAGCPKMTAFSSSISRESEKVIGEQGVGDNTTTLFCDKVVIPNLEYLTLSSINIHEIWHHPSSSSLKHLWVEGCHNLKYIFTSSMLLSLKLLRRIEVKECNTMEQVIREDEEEATAHEFTFPELYSVEIKACFNLTNFYLGSRALEFPKLSHIAIVGCPKMTAFSSSISRESEKVIGEQGVGDNTTTLFCHKVVIPNLEYLTLSSINIHEIWHHPSSSSLKHLQVEGCHNLKYLFPSFLLKDLVMLQRLEIKDCNVMEQVIFTDGLGAEDQWRNHTIFSKLELLSLGDLPKLTNFCFQNYSEFPCLKELTLKKCPLLKTFISKSVCGDEPQIHQPTQTNDSAVLNEKVVFPRLEKLRIQNCDSLEEIIELQGLIANESQSTSATRSTMAETVTTKLPRLKSFFSRMHTSQWPSLKQMDVIECPKAQIFGEVQISNQQPLFCVNEDTFPVLQDLTLTTSDMMKGICDGQLSLCFPNLELLNLQFFPETSTTLPYSFIRSLPNLQKLVINNASISELVRSEGLFHNEIDTSAFSQLKELSLSELPELTLKTLFEGLINEERHASACDQLEALRLSQLPELTLKTLEPFLLSFKNLLSMEVSRCHGFINLMACATAKSLTLLESLSIDDCEMIQEIIACEGEEIQGNIVFPKLKYLKLSCLPSLASFSLAHHLLEFPVLQTVKVKKCPKMKNFCQGELSTPRLEPAHLTGDEDGELQWEGDLNTSIKHMFDEMNVQNSQAVEVTDQLGSV
ncbi:hypothetical protein ES319_D10G292000v1 [Gossypium barbadense]|uniref:Uncharacterized protein n=1 Tax=Gossypium barbadense TaxID=3634 RepID=A0A5J5PWR6_GOSBA|nr:hypothetical protein ES319_D10G292000v1 [Gossypium barbadense]